VRGGGGGGPMWGWGDACGRNIFFCGLSLSRMKLDACSKARAASAELARRPPCERRFQTRQNVLQIKMRSFYVEQKQACKQYISMR
jgi:hypothetical protein